MLRETRITYPYIIAADCEEGTLLPADFDTEDHEPTLGVRIGEAKSARTAVQRRLARARFRRGDHAL